MIINNARIDGEVFIEHADSDGFHIKQTEGSVWLSYEQLDDIVTLLSTLRTVNGEER